MADNSRSAGPVRVRLDRFEWWCQEHEGLLAFVRTCATFGAFVMLFLALVS